jgi:hypothetical protein
LKRHGLAPRAREEPYLLWVGGFIVALVVLAFVVANASGRLPVGVPPPVLAAEQLTEFPRTPVNGTSCEEIGSSDLRSPLEGLWFQSNCIVRPEAPLGAASTSCNRTSLDSAEFREVSPGLYIFRQTPSSHAYLWHSSSETCFDLVSAKVVTAVCADQTVTFNWKTSACSSHGGVLAWVNGR